MLQDLIYTNGDIKFPYILHLPNGWEKGKKYPFILFLHGAGERGEGFEHYKIAVPKMLKNGYCPDAVIVAPQCAKSLTWNLQIFELKRFLDDMIVKYGGDEGRIYITGLSMGGYGTWEMITNFPSVFAAAGPVCGGGMAWRAPIAKDIPIRAYHGADDTTVLPVNSQMMVDKINSAGGKAELFIIDGLAHNCWDYAYEKAGLIEWLLTHKK